MTTTQYFLAVVCLVPLIIGLRTMALHLWSRARLHQADDSLYDVASIELSTLQTQLEEERAKSRRYFASIETVIRERDTWSALYHSQSLGHDNAQNLMLEQITLLQHAYTRETGKAYQLPPIINAVREAWSQEHSPAAREEHSKAPQTTEATP